MRFESTGMRIVSCREVSHFVYEVVTESDRYGCVTRDVLVLPGSLVNPSEQPE
jgi:hypothetical protein